LGAVFVVVLVERLTLGPRVVLSCDRDAFSDLPLLFDFSLVVSEALSFWTLEGRCCTDIPAVGALICANAFLLMGVGVALPSLDSDPDLLKTDE
jgi:hypothetical protein